MKLIRKPNYKINGTAAAAAKVFCARYSLRCTLLGCTQYGWRSVANHLDLMSNCCALSVAVVPGRGREVKGGNKMRRFVKENKVS